MRARGKYPSRPRPLPQKTSHGIGSLWEARWRANGCLRQGSFARERAPTRRYVAVWQAPFASRLAPARRSNPYREHPSPASGLPTCMALCRSRYSGELCSCGSGLGRDGSSRQAPIAAKAAPTENLARHRIFVGSPLAGEWVLAASTHRGQGRSDRKARTASDFCGKPAGGRMGARGKHPSRPRPLLQESSHGIGFFVGSPLAGEWVLATRFVRARARSHPKVVAVWQAPFASGLSHPKVGGLIASTLRPPAGFPQGWRGSYKRARLPQRWAEPSALTLAATVEARAARGRGPQGIDLDGRSFSLRHGGRIENPRAKPVRAGAQPSDTAAQRHPFPSDAGARSGEGEGRRLFATAQAAAMAKPSRPLADRTKKAGRFRDRLFTTTTNGDYCTRCTLPWSSTTTISPWRIAEASFTCTLV